MRHRASRRFWQHYGRVVTGRLFEDDGALTFGSVVGALFRPMDGVWILLAFFTAYKIGSSQAEG